MAMSLGLRTAALALGLSLSLTTATADAARPRDQAPDAAPARGLPDNQLAPLSLRMLQQGEGHLAAGKNQAAADSFEAALGADPRNRKAYLGLARAAEAEGLPGKAVRFYREALEIEPNDVGALELQGVALVERGAAARAGANLDRLRKLCAAPCPPADRLAAAIKRGPSAAAKAPAVPPPGQTAALGKAED